MISLAQTLVTPTTGTSRDSNPSLAPRGGVAPLIQLAEFPSKTLTLRFGTTTVVSSGVETLIVTTSVGSGRVTTFLTGIARTQTLTSTIPIVTVVPIDPDIQSKSTPLGRGAIAGLSLGIVGLFLIGLIAYALVRRFRQKLPVDREGVGLIRSMPPARSLVSMIQGSLASAPQSAPNESGFRFNKRSWLEHISGRLRHRDPPPVPFNPSLEPTPFSRDLSTVDQRARRKREEVGSSGHVNQLSTERDALDTRQRVMETRLALDRVQHLTVQLERELQGLGELARQPGSLDIRGSPDVIIGGRDTAFSVQHSPPPTYRE